MEEGCFEGGRGKGMEVNLPGDGLRAEERACGVDVQGASPLLGRHVDGVLAAYDAGETD